MALSALSRAGLGAWASYNASLAARPLLTKSLTSFTGFIVGDAIAQATSSQPRYDWRRTARFAAFGFLLHAPGCHVFYRALDALVFPGAPTRCRAESLLRGPPRCLCRGALRRNPGCTRSTKAVIAKILVDQTLWTPVSICAFYAFLLTFEGRAEAIAQTIRDKFWPTLLAGYAVWPLAHVINFKFVGGEHRLLYINCVQARPLLLPLPSPAP